VDLTVLGADQQPASQAQTPNGQILVQQLGDRSKSILLMIIHHTKMNTHETSNFYGGIKVCYK